MNRVKQILPRLGCRGIRLHLERKNLRWFSVLY